VITDPPPRGAKRRAEFSKSEGITRIPLPEPELTRAATQQLAVAMADGDKSPVRSACVALLGELARFYQVPMPEVKVLGVRPHVVTAGVCTYQLFGDYTPALQRIRVWMRTAMRGQVSSPKALLNTLLHEFCHHLDATRLACPDSPHTRGFYARVDHLYHFALATPEQARRPLHWIKRGTRWQIDWQRSRTRAALARSPLAPERADDQLVIPTRGSNAEDI
jgi:hypothetical protein